MTRVLVAVLCAFTTVACGDQSPVSPSAPSSATPTPISATGTWSGTAADSSSTSATAGMMGQAGMGAMSWQLTQTGSMVTGTMSFAGMQGHMPGAFSGTIAGDQLAFTMTLPMRSMMSPECSANASGLAHINWSTMTMTGTYQGMHSCTGPFVNGQMTMTHR